MITVTLDWLVERFALPKVIKIDVEGAEDRVLMGAAKILSSVRLLVLCEVFEENGDAVSRLLKSFGYTLFDANIDAPNRRPMDFPAYNMLGLPEQHINPSQVP